MADIRQYTTWAEQRIGRLVISEGLHCGLLGVTQGPLTLTFRVRMLSPSPTALRKLMGLDRALSQALQVSGVRITEQSGHIAIEIPSPQPRTPSAEQLARASRQFSVAVGYDAQRRPVSVDLRQHGALFWIGPSRRGKTQSLRSTLYSLARCNPERLRFAILCHERKRDDWQAFDGARQNLGIVTTPAEQESVLAWAASEFMEKMTDGMRLVIVADDLLNLLSQADLAGSLAEIASMGAGLGIHLLAGTQEAGSKRGTGGAGVENNATARILYRNSNAAAAARATGQGAEGLQQLSGAKGDALLLLDGEPVRVATGLADDRDILQLEQGEGLRRPWLSSGCAQPSTTISQPPATSHNHLQPPVAVPHVGATVGDARGGGAQPVAVVAPDMFPIDKRQPTESEAETIRELHSAGHSLNSLCKAVYGHKDGKGYAWVKEALETPQETPGKQKIDMNTAEGLARVEALKSAGLLREDDITEVIKHH